MVTINIFCRLWNLLGKIRLLQCLTSSLCFLDDILLPFTWGISLLFTRICLKILMILIFMLTVSHDLCNNGVT